MSLKVVKFEEVHPRQRATWFRVETEEFPGGTPVDSEAVLARLALLESLAASAASAAASAAAKVDALEDVIDDLVEAAGAIESFTLQCVTAPDTSIHEVFCVFEDGFYNLKVNQAPSGSLPLLGITFTADDFTDHIMELVLEDGFYNLRINQSPSGSGPVPLLKMKCLTDSAIKNVTVKLKDGFYNRSFE